jgi:hypothetical protein
VANVYTVKGTTGDYRVGQPGKVIKAVVDFHGEGAKGQISSGLVR